MFIASIKDFVFHAVGLFAEVVFAFVPTTH